MSTLESHILKDEYDVISNDIYAALFTSTQLVDEYAQWLRSALLKNAFQTKAQRAHVIQFLAKLQTQRELLELSQNPEQLKEAQKAAASFSRKNKINA